MTDRPSEATRMHTRLLKCTLEVDDSRSFWAHALSANGSTTARKAFDEYWFGGKSLGRVEVLMSNLRARYAEYPEALRVLAGWEDMDPDTRRLICHWHLQLSDPLYRAFTGVYLVDRRDAGRPSVTHDLVVSWVGERAGGRWNMATRIQFASKLLSSAFTAGLVGSTRDPRPLPFPRVTEPGLAYIMYLLREVTFEGTLLENPYLASVGLRGATLEDRLRNLSSLRFRRQGDLVEFGWRYGSLSEWASASVSPSPVLKAGGVR